MTIEKIILGDDDIEFAKKAMPYIPGAQVDFVEDPATLIKMVKAVGYTTIISDLNYLMRDKQLCKQMNGIEVFRYLAKEKISPESRKVLWTGDAHKPEVQAAAKELGLILLDKDELGTLVGLSVSKAPLKTDGKVLVYMQGDDCLYRSIKQVIGMFAKDHVDISNKLEESLMSGRYGLVIDCSLIRGSGGWGAKNGSVAHDMKYMQLSCVPKVVCVNNVSTFLVDTLRAVAVFYQSRFQPQKGESE